MRALVVIVLLLLGLGVVAILSWQAQGDVLAPSGDGVAAGANVQRVTQLPAGVVALRTQALHLAPEELADRPTTCLRIVDYRTDKPLEGAIVRRMRNGADLAFSDALGLARIPLAKPAQLAVVLDGYLLRLAPARLGSSEQSPQIVRLVRDQWSLVRRFAFVDANGHELTDVFVRLRPLGKPPQTRSPVPADDAVVRRAWSEHTMLAARPVSHDVAVQLGRFRVDRVHRLRAQPAIVRFIVPGDYELEAATTTGLLARAEVSVLPGSEPPVQRILLRAGAMVSGRVTDLAGTPLADAQITVQGGEPLGLRATTSPDGTFSLAPLPIGTVTLLARHGLHEPIAFGPVATPAEGVWIKLRALPRTSLRGRVRARPGLEPIAQATVIWQVAGGAAVTAKTSADGTFALQATGDIAARLMVQVGGYVTYAELVDPTAPFADYDLLPADALTRVAKAITATLEGVAFARDGTPLAGVAVRWSPAAPTVSPGPGAAAILSRRILEGWVLQLPGVATTDSAGAFVLETNQFGGGQLALDSDAASAVQVTAVAGQRKTGLELHR